MAMREIRTVGDPVLRTPCDPITTIDARVRGVLAAFPFEVRKTE